MSFQMLEIFGDPCSFAFFKSVYRVKTAEAVDLYIFPCGPLLYA